MLDFLTTIEGTMSMSIIDMLLKMAVAIVLGIMIGATYKFTEKDEASVNMSFSLVIMPVLMASIIALIGTNVAGAFSLAGIFSVIRFRSTAGTSKDIIYVLFAVGSGLAVGVAAYSVAIIFTFVLSLVFVSLKKLGIGERSSSTMTLKIVAPENLSDSNAFDEVLKEYTEKYTLKKLGTKDLGSVFEFVYEISIKDSVDSKTFIDQIRIRNGNMNVSLHKLIDANEL